MIYMVKFGDLFHFNEKDYVFLAKTDELLFAAQVLDTKQSQWIKGLHEKRLKNNKTAVLCNRNVLFCYVVLTTESLKDRIAHLKETAHDGDVVKIETLNISLCKADMVSIKEEILGGFSAVSKELKNLVRDIDLSVSKH